MAESSVRDTALGGADTAGSRGGSSGDAGEAERSVGGYGRTRFLLGLGLERVVNLEIILRDYLVDILRDLPRVSAPI